MNNQTMYHEKLVLSSGLCLNERKITMRTVVLIDDDQIFRQILARSLEDAGWRVLEAGDGDVGLALIQEHRPALVLCDLLMPRCNGYQVCRTIRADPELASRTKIIVTTGSDFPSDRITALDAGADEVLVKPVRNSALVEVIKRMTTGTAKNDRPAAADSDTSHLRAASSLGSGHTNPAGFTRKGTRIKFWGVRGSIPTPGPTTVRYGGNTSCVEVRADEEIIILDAGTGIRPLGLQLASEFKGKPLSLHLLLTHTHWDHIQGFPFFVPAYNPQHQLKILGFEGARRGLESTLSSQMESPYFPIGMHQMPANINIVELKEMKFNIGKVEVHAEFTNHPGICVGYRVYTSNGSVAFLPDNEPWVRVDARPDSELSTDDHARKEFATARDATLVEFLRGTDVLILDCQYDLEEYKTHVGWGHGCIDAVVQLALRSEVKRLYLFHHDPGHDDARIDQFVNHARQLVNDAGAKMEVQAAMEGAEILLQTKNQKSEIAN